MKFYLQSIAFLFISISSVYGQYPKTGLVGNYMFSGNASNLVNNTNNGTVYQASLSSDRFGNQNSAYLSMELMTILTSTVLTTSTLEP